ncbi:MAG TPA: S-methyl-5'-thioadenosine phosphorylase [Bacteroidales bacterium]|nr:S-methyl-5'-thioadenosine phosphorylase [Bacteroidales bacterium]
MIKIGIIGGSGLEKLNIFNKINEISVETPYGSPSSTFFCGTMEEKEVYILSRHGRNHSISPTHVNNRANIIALKQLGCQYIIATTACGSLREEIQRGDFVLADQFIDFTRFRKNTFFDSFDNGLHHVAMPDPFSEDLRQQILRSSSDLNLNIHPTGAIITIEGPRFSTRAESKMFRLWGADVVNMSTAPEAMLANEAEIPYAAIAISTDYDSWKHDEEPVTWEDVLKVFNQNVVRLTDLLIKVIKDI